MDRPVDEAPRLRRRWLIAAAAAAALVLIGATTLPGILRWASSERAVDATALRFGTVTRGDLVREVAVDGSVVAAFRPTLTSPARGVARVEVQAGQTVARDQVLVRVESPEVNSRLAQERSALLSAQSDLQRQRIQARQDKLQRQQNVALLGVQLEAARRAMDRAERTKQMGILNDVDYEKVQDEVKLAEMRFASAKQEAGLAGETLAFEVTNRESRVEQQRLVVTELERQVDALAVKAPFAGLVSRVAVADRDSVTEGQPLVGVVDLSRLELEVWVPESYAPDIKPGTPAVITIDARQFPGEVTSLSPEVQGSRVRGVVGFQGAAPAGLKQNQRVSAKLVLETRRDVLKVPRGPFLEALGERGAYVVDDDEAELRPIEVGSVSVSEVEIASGLEEGDQIVLSDPTPFQGAKKVSLQR
ncbi:MAG TPA: HlyD family efflux transporter periplasmic adaptor subunit [Thermoanaerobaculia bacterium]|jgi:HlyD family secretion protein|nr:HlyD family efflux transporter periplasmic adaptor subunit [Thermoanaerobaculia bacterium]